MKIDRFSFVTHYLAAFTATEIEKLDNDVFMSFDAKSVAPMSLPCIFNALSLCLLNVQHCD